jgi:hypothetical protein
MTPDDFQTLSGMDRHATGWVGSRPHVALIAEGGEPEMVGPVGFMAKALAGAMAINGGQTGAGPSVAEIRLYVDGREFARAQAPHLPGELRRLGVRIVS